MGNTCCAAEINFNFYECDLKDSNNYKDLPSFLSPPLKKKRVAADYLDSHATFDGLKESTAGATSNQMSMFEVTQSTNPCARKTLGRMSFRKGIIGCQNRLSESKVEVQQTLGHYQTYFQHKGNILIPNNNNAYTTAQEKPKKTCGELF